VLDADVDDDATGGLCAGAEDPDNSLVKYLPVEAGEQGWQGTASSLEPFRPT
jgi:hypothetical protein